VPEKRNIVLITFDSLRADHCGFMGYTRKTTPTLDKMAKDGLYFENAIASGVPTPVSMVGVFTGDYSYNDPACVKPEPWRKELASRKTLAQVLTNKGYFTGAFHENVRVSSHFGFNKGFKYYNDSPTSIGVKAKIHDKLLVPLFEKMGFSTEIPDMLMRVGTCAPWEAFYEHIINWIKKAKEPFFLWVLLLDTHTPYIPPRRFRKYSNLCQVYYYSWKVGKICRTKRTDEGEKYRKIINVYDDAIRYADHFVGKLWGDIKDYDPIVIIHSDHGDGFYEHGFYQHSGINGLYEELIHVPLIIYNADVKGKIEKPISLLGLSPAILELIGEENKFPSKSFLNGGTDWCISKIFVRGKRIIAVRMKDWKFITGQKEEDELYNLKEDPYERKNVITEHPKLADEMRKIVKSHIRQEKERRRIGEITSKLLEMRI